MSVTSPICVRTATRRAPVKRRPPCAAGARLEAVLDDELAELLRESAGAPPLAERVPWRWGAGCLGGGTSRSGSRSATAGALGGSCGGLGGRDHRSVASHRYCARAERAPHKRRARATSVAQLACDASPPSSSARNVIGASVCSGGCGSGPSAGSARSKSRSSASNHGSSAAASGRITRATASIVRSVRHSSQSRIYSCARETARATVCERESATGPVNALSPERSTARRSADCGCHRRATRRCRRTARRNPGRRAR